MSNVDKLVQYAELKVGQFGEDYREHHEHDKVKEVAPREIEGNGLNIIVRYDDKSYVIHLDQSGVNGEITEEEAAEVVDRMKEFYRFHH